jgi:hypothetical protein
LKAACPADQPRPISPIWLIPASAARTNKSFTPAQSFEVAQTIGFTRESVFKLAPCLGIVLTGNWRMLGFAHAAIMAQVELNG